jgi:hypothetical protein
LSKFLADNFDKRRIVGMPLPFIVYDGEGIVFQNALIIPAGAKGVAERLRIISNPENHIALQEKYGGEWFKSASTGVTLGQVLAHPIILIAIQYDWERVGINPNHNYTMSVLSDAQELAQSALDILRFDLCGITRRHSIPGTPGMLNSRENFTIGIFYSNDSDHEGHMFAGQTGNGMLVPPGLGLEVYAYYEPTEIKNGEVGNIVRHALFWYRLAINASGNTQRFVLLFSLLELLADPENYTKSKSVQNAVGLHVAEDKKQYQKICETFKRFSGAGKSDGLGPRTQIVHLGKRMEDLLISQKEIDAVMTEMENWASIIMSHLIGMADKNWESVKQFRRERKAGRE